MSNIKNFLVIFFLTLPLQNIHATEVGRESIARDSYIIQVGAFKNISNIEKIESRLSKYNIYREPYKNMYRVHVVNVFSPHQKDTLLEIRKIYPQAFIVKRQTKSAKKAWVAKKSSSNYSQSFKSKPTKLNDIKSFQQNLDSNTILKTRKSFL